MIWLQLFKSGVGKVTLEIVTLFKIQYTVQPFQLLNQDHLIYNNWLLSDYFSNFLISVSIC